MKNNTIALTFTSGMAAFAILAGIGIVASSAQAAVITTGCFATNDFCSLLELFRGGTIQVGDKLFSQWRLVRNNKPGGRDDRVETALVEVRGIAQDTNAPGLEFRSVMDELQVSGSEGRLTLEFDFKVEVVEPGLSRGDLIADNELRLNGTVLDAGNMPDPKAPPDAQVQIVETVGTERGGTDLVGENKKRVFEEISPDRSEPNDREVFAPQTFVWVRDRINLQTNKDGAIAGIVRFEQTFSQCNPNIIDNECPDVPEPTSALSLLALGTLGAASTLKRQLKPLLKIAPKESQ